MNREELIELRNQTETMLGGVAQEMGNMVSVLVDTYKRAGLVSLEEEELLKRHRLAFSLYENWKNDVMPRIREIQNNE